MADDRTELLVFSGTAYPALTARIADALECPLGAVESRRFPDGEIFVKYQQSIRGADVFIVQPGCRPPNENLMELLIMLDAAKRASAGRITAVLPYYPYARQDRKEQSRVPISARLVADLLTTAGAARVLVLDLHTQQIQGFFNIPVDHLNASPVLGAYLRTVLGPDAIVVSPDSGSVKMAYGYADMLGLGFAIVAKRRLDASRVASSHLVGDVAGRDCVLVDDLTTTGRTLIEAGRILTQHGARRVFAAVTHCCLTPAAYAELVSSPITELITTDSVPLAVADPAGRIRVLGIARLLAEAILRTHEQQSVSSLFNPGQLRNAQGS
jgi:ribose-phosphate pyrophosphokinase